MPRPKKNAQTNDFAAVFAGERVDRSRAIGPQIYELIRLKIILSQLPSGTQINEFQLANLLGVSRTPVREAYQKLADDGLIVSRPQVGSVIAPIDDQRVVEGIIVRRALECEVIKLLCHQTPDLSALDPVLALQQVSVKRGDYVAFFKHDEAFHAQLADLAGIPAAWRLAQSVKAHTDQARIRLMSSIPNRIETAFGEHKQLIAAIGNANTDEAQTIISRHINSVFDAVGALTEARSA